jgi:hypothetical protein
MPPLLLMLGWSAMLHGIVRAWWTRVRECGWHGMPLGNKKPRKAALLLGVQRLRSRCDTLIASIPANCVCTPWKKGPLHKKKKKKKGKKKEQRGAGATHRSSSGTGSLAA